MLVAGAMEREVSTLQSLLKCDCLFLVTGVGTSKTERSLHQYFRSKLPSCLIFTGNAGQLDPTLQLGQVVLPEEWCLEDGSCFRVNRGLAERLRKQNWKFSRRGITVSTPVLRKKSRLSLHERWGAQICDMESAAAIKVALAYGVPCLAPKIVSDTADSGIRAFWSRFEEHMMELAGYLDRLITLIG